MSGSIYVLRSGASPFYKILENLIEITASKGSIAVGHVFVVPDAPLHVIPW
jgi:hypothetical protein